MKVFNRIQTPPSGLFNQYYPISKTTPSSAGVFSGDMKTEVEDEDGVVRHLHLKRSLNVFFKKRWQLFIISSR